LNLRRCISCEIRELAERIKAQLRLFKDALFDALEAIDPIEDPIKALIKDREGNTHLINLASSILKTISDSAKNRSFFSLKVPH
jgi:hypothetical protein